MKAIKTIFPGVMSIVGGMLLSLPTAMAEGDAEQGRIKFNTCAGCHALPSYFNVSPVYHVPKLAGQYQDYLVAALMAYAAELRDHGGMYANATSLTEEDMQDISAYLSGLPVEKDSVAVRGDVEAGKAKAATCDTCHAPDAGEGQVPRPPKLAGQHQDYLEHALRGYRDGQRQNAIMAGMSAALSDQDIRDISAYYSSQEPALGTVPR